MVIDKALEEIDVSYGPEKMRRNLRGIRFKDAGEFRDRLLEALKESNVPVNNYTQSNESIVQAPNIQKKPNGEDII